MGQVVVIRPPSRASLAPTGSGLHTLFARQKNQWEQALLPQAPGFIHYLPARKTSGSKAAPTGPGLHTLSARQKNQWEQGCSHRLRASHTICPPEKPVGARLLPQAPASHTICPPEKPVGARLLPQAPGFTHYLPARKTSGSKAAPTGSGLHTLFARQKNQWEQGCSHRLRASHTICPPEKPVGARLLPQAPASHTICLPEKPVGARLARDGAGTDTSYHRRAKVSPRTPDTLRQCTRASRIMKFTRVGETPSSLAMSFCGTPCRRYISKA